MLIELKVPLANLKNEVLEVWGRLDSTEIEEKITQKEALTLENNFWDTPSAAEKILGEIKSLKNRIYPWKKIIAELEDAQTLLELALETNDETLEDEIKTQFDAIKKDYEHLQILTLLSDEVDKNNAFLTIHAGAGGTESCDWASMLFRMYCRWAERNGFKAQVVDMLEAEGGIKSVTVEITGDYVFGYLKGEAGVHRLVRISPFDSNARRHTSFTSVYVFPVLDDSIEVDIKPEDLRVDTYRAGGAGGQHVNKTDSAVRFTHIPTGIVVACQTERSQIMNRATAMSVLKARLYEHYRQEKEKENAKFAQEKKDISWGNQIRSYVFQPYTMVKDHRTKHESGNIQAVMDGDIDSFIETFLSIKWQNTGASK
ncbi:MAG: peptide chain release factor 2 [Treponemataceae bacterium]